jgi:serine/threonine-protein kinase
MGIVGNYRITKKIAEGGFAVIYQAEHLALEELACIKQTLKPTREYVELLRQEAKILWKLDEHHSIPHAKDFTVLDDGSAIMVMSYIDGTTLEDLVQNVKLGAEDACWITERLLDALYYCHYNGVVHSDIKPGNLIVEPKKHDIKLIDFGLSVYRPSKNTRPVGYTAVFVAPELLQEKPPIPETDLYGAGICMLYMLGGDPVQKTLPSSTPKELDNFCSSLLRYDPMQRPNWENANPIEMLSQIRQKVFGRKHTDAYSRTSLA